MHLRHPRVQPYHGFRLRQRFPEPVELLKRIEKTPGIVLPAHGVQGVSDGKIRFGVRPVEFDRPRERFEGFFTALGGRIGRTRMVM